MTNRDRERAIGLLNEVDAARRGRRAVEQRQSIGLPAQYVLDELMPFDAEEVIAR